MTVQIMVFREKKSLISYKMFIVMTRYRVFVKFLMFGEITSLHHDRLFEKLYSRFDTF
eukprot:UN12519